MANGIEWQPDVATAQEKARRENKQVFVDIFSPT